MEGIFIRKHALSLLPFLKVTVIAPKSSSKLGQKFVFETLRTEEGLFEIRARYLKSSLPIVSKLINVFRQIFSVLKAVKMAEELSGKIQVFIFPVLHSTFPTAFVLKLIKRKPIVIMEHFSGAAMPELYGLSPFYFLIYRFLAKKACAVVAVSEFLKQKLSLRGIKANFAVVPNVVEPLQATCFKVREGPKTVLFVGGLREKVKNVSLLLKAAKILSENRNDFQVVVVGGGEDESRLKEMAESLGISSRVKFVGSVKPEKVADFYAQADVLVITSFVETFSVAAAEALSCGVPVITTPCGGPEEFVREGRGVVLKSFEPEELARALDDVLSGKVKFNKTELKEFALNNFSKEAVGRKLYQVVEKCLKKSERI